MNELPTRARIYLLTLSALGWGGLLILGLASWESTNWVRFLFYSLIFVYASCLKVWLPRITGTMSMNFVLVLLAVLELSLSEALAMVSLGTVGQMLWRAQDRPTVARVSFNVANMVIATTCAYKLYHSPATANFLMHPMVALAASVCLYFTMNTMSVATIVGLCEGRSPLKTWKESYFWSFPYYVVGAAIAAVVAYANLHAGWQASLLALPMVFVMYKSFQLYFSRLESEVTHAKDLADLHLCTIESLAAAIEAKDEGTHEHLERAQVYAVEMGKHLNLPDTEIKALETAAILHDIGKLAVPEHIISKPGRLTREEFEKMKIHPVVGADILSRVHFPYPVTPLVRHHHERWDGSGYPDGLRGEAIPIGARILSIVDCLDALASDRPYRRALPLDEAMETIRAQSGKSYDSDLVKILSENYRHWDKLARAAPKSHQKLNTRVRVGGSKEPSAGLQPEQATARGDHPRTTSQGDFISQVATARDEVQALCKLNINRGTSLSVEEMASVLDTRLSRLLDYDTLVVYTRRDSHLVPSYVSGVDKQFFWALQIPIGEGLSGWVADNAEPILNGNPSVECGYMEGVPLVNTLRSALAIPLRRFDETIGVLALYHREAAGFSRHDVQVLMSVGPKIAVALESGARFRSSEVSAATGSLTGLPGTRSLFLHLHTELSRCQQKATPLSVFVCELDTFKPINGNFGHLVGNQFLELTAKRFGQAIREEDYVARTVGDEFVLVMPDIGQTSAAEKVRLLKKIVGAIGLEVCGDAGASVSVGTASYPEDATDVEGLLAAADQRMDQEKQLRNQQADSNDLENFAIAVSGTSEDGKRGTINQQARGTTST